MSKASFRWLQNFSIFARDIESKSESKHNIAAADGSSFSAISVLCWCVIRLKVLSVDNGLTIFCDRI